MTCFRRDAPADVERIIVRQTGRLDWAHVVAQLEPLAELKGEADLLAKLEQRRGEFER